MTGARTGRWNEHLLAEPADRVRREIDRARAALEPPADVHEARRALKQARALLRLLETDPGEAEARRIRHLLRETGRTLSATRDREVAVEMARRVERDFGGPSRVVEDLEARCAAAQTELDGGLGERIRRDLAVVAREGTALQGTVAPPEAVARVARAYRRARAAHARARHRPTAERLHTLRKRAKDFRYQLEWLTPLWPPVLEGWARELHGLTDELGHLQDLRTFRAARPPLTDPRDRRRLARALHATRREGHRERRNALQRCRRLFAEDPDAFEARLAAWMAD